MTKVEMVEKNHPTFMLRSSWLKIHLSSILCGMDITVAYNAKQLTATRGEDSINLPEKMAFLVGTGPQRIEAAFADALRGKYQLKPEDLQIVRRWLRYRTLQ